jgi:hypothetical protein
VRVQFFFKVIHMLNVTIFKTRVSFFFGHCFSLQILVWKSNWRFA